MVLGFDLGIVFLFRYFFYLGIVFWVGIWVVGWKGRLVGGLVGFDLGIFFGNVF